MEILTEEMTQKDIMKVEDALERSLDILKKIALYLFGISAVILFIPAEILKIFSRRRNRTDVSGMLFNDLGLVNTLLYIVLPICLLLVIIYFYGAHRLKKDLKDNLKEIGFVKVASIKEL